MTSVSRRPTARPNVGGQSWAIPAAPRVLGRRGPIASYELNLAASRWSVGRLGIRRDANRAHGTSSAASGKRGRHLSVAPRPRLGA